MGEITYLKLVFFNCKMGMATHSSILAWRIPWTEEPGARQSRGVTRVGHDLATKPPPTTKLVLFNCKIGIIKVLVPVNGVDCYHMPSSKRSGYIIGCLQNTWRSDKC